MMRKGCLLLVLALTGPGCLSSGTHAGARPTPEQMAEVPPPPAVTVDQIDEANAAEKAQALNREMDYEAGSPPAAPAMATPNTNIMKP